MEIQGRAALVVGGASGMARATAEMLVREGARVALLDLPTSKGEEAAAALGGGTRFHACDVNPMLNGSTIRLDGGQRFSPK